MVCLVNLVLGTTIDKRSDTFVFCFFLLPVLFVLKNESTNDTQIDSLTDMSQDVTRVSNLETTSCLTHTEQQHVHKRASGITYRHFLFTVLCGDSRCYWRFLLLIMLQACNS